MTRFERKVERKLKSINNNKNVRDLLLSCVIDNKIHKQKMNKHPKFYEKDGSIRKKYKCVKGIK